MSPAREGEKKVSIYTSISCVHILQSSTKPNLFSTGYTNIRTRVRTRSVSMGKIIMSVVFKSPRAIANKTAAIVFFLIFSFGKQVVAGYIYHARYINTYL